MLIYHLRGPIAHGIARCLQNLLNATSDRICLRRALHVIAASQSLGEYARRPGISAERHSIVPNGVPVEVGLADVYQQMLNA